MNRVAVLSAFYGVGFLIGGAIVAAWGL